jgi:uncharacterized integral membrane protein (TIGR00698 family)
MEFLTSQLHINQQTTEVQAVSQKLQKVHSSTLLHKVLFISCGLLCLWPRVDTAMALAAGVTFSLLFSNPYSARTSKLSKLLLQISVVGLGFGISIQQVIQEGRHSIVYTIIGISFTLLIGNFIGRLFKVNSNISQLISFGTAICGGSAIAAMAPVIKARDEEIAISLATVFTLNSIALLLFPFIGHLLKLNEVAFGTWAALAIHDTSSVVGAASSYGAIALATGTTVKLTRALWITPVTLGYAYFKKSKQKAAFPLFIFGFIAAAFIHSLLPAFNGLWEIIAFSAKRILVVTLFLIGAGLTITVLKKVGIQPLFQAILLWLTVSTATLLFILKMVH